MWYDNLARAYGHNMAKIIKVLIGRNPKKDFRVKNPLVLPNLNIEGDSKTESRRQSFCYFNAKVQRNFKYFGFFFEILDKKNQTFQIYFSLQKNS